MSQPETIKPNSKNFKKILENYLNQTLDITNLASQIPEVLLEDHLPLEIPINILTLY